MSLNILRLNISQPCREDWNNMTSLEQGAYCNSCSKIVTDFTTMSDTGIIEFFQKRKGENVCGRLRNEQINKPMFSISPEVLKMNIPFWKKFLAAVFICFSAFIAGCENKTSNYTHIPLPQPVVINKTSSKAIVNPTESSTYIDEKINYVPSSKNDSMGLNWITMGFITAEPQLQLPIIVPKINK